MFDGFVAERKEYKMYEKPVCDCGNKLLFEEESSFVKQYNITQKGHSYKGQYGKNIYVNCIGDRLVCPKCNAVYDFDTDIFGRFVRGKKIK